MGNQENIPEHFYFEIISENMVELLQLQRLSQREQDGKPGEHS
jgi:hypothetical protein